MHITNTSVLPQKQQPHQVRNNFDANWSNSLFPIAVSSGNNLIQNNTTVSRQNHDNLLDNEFGEFTSASVQSPTFVTPTVAGNSSLSSFDSFGFDSSNTDFYLNMPTETIKPQQQLSSSSSSQQHQQTVQSNPTSPSKSKSLNIGSTWKDLESLSIDLDALVKPEKYGTRTQAPSLYQLKQNQPRVQS
ncbi:unnamed protein product [Heterobilharzia americana]|nr:unnamed protein product [Heterobilharzia americana]